MKNKLNFKKGISIFLSVTFLCACLPFFTNNLYNVKAETSSAVSVTAFATKNELMTMFTPNSEGVAPRYGKLAFGNKTTGSAITWYILGKDASVAGDNIAVFATAPILTGKAFSSSTANKEYSDASNGSLVVQAGHYGASDLRASLQQMYSGNTYFTDAEKALMQETTITTYDKNNSINYTVSDILYALSGTFGETYIYAGGTDSIKLSMSSYWSSGALFWLRNPRDIESTYALVAYPNSEVNFRAVNSQEAVRPATNINLTSVLFASSADATMDAGLISSGTAMTLRVNGDNKAIGTAIYDDNKGIIFAQKDEAATGTVSLVVQGKNGNQDWFFTKTVTDEAVVTEENIINALAEDISITDISLENCKIWVENTDENVTYANMAEERILIDSIEVDFNLPIGNKAFDTSVSCNTEGLAGVLLSWTDCDGNPVGEKANFAPWEYVANLVFTPEAGAVILPDVNIDFGSTGAYLDGFNIDADGKLYVKTWEMLSSVANVTNVDITEITELEEFENYYDDSAVLNAYELTNWVNVTLDNEYVEAMDVIWELTGEYDDTPGAVNSFRWTVNLNLGRDYNILTGVTLSGVKEIANKAYMNFEYTVDSFEGSYDAGLHGIEIDVSNEPSAKVYYSLDGVNYQEGLQYMDFRNAGTYTVYYKITMDNYETITGSKTVKILPKPLEVTVADQTINKGENIVNGKYTVSGLITGDRVESITLTTSNSGAISVSNIKIVNANGQDVTANYDITYNQGKLTVNGEENNVVSPDLGEKLPIALLIILLISSGAIIPRFCKK